MEKSNEFDYLSLTHFLSKALFLGIGISRILSSAKESTIFCLILGTFFGVILLYIIVIVILPLRVRVVCRLVRVLRGGLLRVLRVLRLSVRLVRILVRVRLSRVVVGGFRLNFNKRHHNERQRNYHARKDKYTADIKRCEHFLEKCRDSSTAAAIKYIQ